jgi:serine protease AprX
MSDSRFPVAIYYSNDDERERSKELLENIQSDELVEYDGVWEGTADITAVEHLAKSGLLVYFPEGVPRDEAELSALESSSQLYPVSLPADKVDVEALRAFRARAAYVDVPDDAVPGGDEAKLKAVFGMPRLLIIRSEPRTEFNPLLDGIDTDGLEQAPRKLPEQDELLPQDVYRIRFAGKVQQRWRDQMTKENIHVCQYEQPDLCDVFLTPEQLAAVREMPFVREVKRYGLMQTVTPKLLQLVRDQLASERPTLAVRLFDVALHRAEDLDHLRSLIESTKGVAVRDAAPAFIRIEVDANSPLLSALANLPHVRSISPYEPPSLMCEFLRDIVGVNIINQNSAGNPSDWDGAEETVAVIDSGIDNQHPDLTRCEKTSYGVGLADDEYGHGSHVAGIVGGTGEASGGQICGVAPSAKIVSIGIRTAEGTLDLPADWGTLLRHATANAAKIINLSLGRQFKGEYQTGAESVDRFCRENEEVLVVVAAGNDGEARNGHHKLNTVGMPASAKNVITVGASASSRPGNETWGQAKQSHFPMPPASGELVTGDASLIAATSSRGPTDTHQVKPDVVAPGTHILSVRSSRARLPYHPEFDQFGGKYGFLSGTSMAAPVLSGAAAILRQYLREGLNTPNPSAALIKAILIGSAERLPPTPGAIDPYAIGYPDFEQGFGRINLANVMPIESVGIRKIQFADVRNNSDQALAARQPVGAYRKSVRRYKFERDAGSRGPVKVVLAWTDAPGRFVQNNLQLSVQIPAGDRLLGNNLHTAFIPVWSTDAGLDNLDTFNSVEQVVIDNPSEGTYRITIFAQDTPYPPQGYALCIVGDLSDPLAMTL